MRNIYNLLNSKEKIKLICPLPILKVICELLKDFNYSRPEQNRVYRPHEIFELIKDINYSLKNWQILENMPPHTLFFNLTEFCNAKCTFCSYKYSQPKYHMDNEIFLKASSQYYEVGGKNINLAGISGEPLLDPGFFEKMAMLESIGDFDSITLITNGILLSRDSTRERILKSCISNINISSAGFQKQIYERFTGVKKYNDFMTGVTNLLIENAELGNPIKISINIRGTLEAVNTNDFIEKILPIIEKFSINPDFTFLRLFDDWIGQIPVEGLPNNCGFEPYGYFRRRPCCRTFTPCILTNGNLRLCNCRFGEKGRNDTLSIGNITNNSLMDILKSKEALLARRTTCKPQMNEICSNCRLYWPITVGSNISMARHKESIT